MDNVTSEPHGYEMLHRGCVDVATLLANCVDYNKLHQKGKDMVILH
jgi:hypothetical protein